MDNILKGAKFGDKFRMRNGRMALFMKRNKYRGKYLMFRLDNSDDNFVIEYYVDIDGKREQHIETQYDLISKWEEEQ